jgi:hypothetical protein
LRRRLFSMKFTAASNDQPHDFRESKSPNHSKTTGAFFQVSAMH